MCLQLESRQCKTNILVRLGIPNSLYIALIPKRADKVKCRAEYAVQHSETTTWPLRCICAIYRVYMFPLHVGITGAPEELAKDKESPSLYVYAIRECCEFNTKTHILYTFQKMIPRYKTGVVPKLAYLRMNIAKAYKINLWWVPFGIDENCLNLVMTFRACHTSIRSDV